MYNVRMRLRLLAIAVAIFVIVTSSVRGAKPTGFDSLNPGGLPDLEETVRVNTSFVGYESTI